MHLNKKHVLFRVERSQEVLKTILVVTAKETSRAELKATFLDQLNVIRESLIFGFGGIGQFFKKVCTETVRTIVHFQNDIDHASKKKTVFFKSWHGRRCQTPDVRNQSTKRGL